MKAFLICGYGIPEDIRKDQNYLTYLHVVFNRIYAQAKNEPALIIPCGGPTSCTPPYTGTEAEHIAEYLQELMSRDIMNGAASAWKIVLEDKSLSSLENLIFAKKIVEENGGDHIVFFCEATRAQQNQENADRIFGKETVQIEGVDFDISKNRYLPDELLEKKERAIREHTAWALQSEENMQKHHEIFEERLKRLRQWDSEGMSHVDAVARWQKESIELYEQMKK